jgi:hypothetical protein
MKQGYDTSTEKLLAIRDRLEVMIDLLARQMDSHPQIVAACLVAITSDRLGRDGLDDLISAARGARQRLINEEKTDAREARQERERRQRQAS